MSYFGGAQSDGRRTGLNPRLIGALLIAVVGIAMYMFNTEVNPVTGEKQHIAMSVDQEKALGLQAAPEMAAQMGAPSTRRPIPSEAGRAGRPRARPEERRQPQPLRRQLQLLSPGRSQDDQRVRPPRRADFHHPGRCWTSSKTRPSSPASWATRSAT